MNIALDARLSNNEKPARAAALADSPARKIPAGDYRAGQKALSPTNQPNYEMQAEALRPKPADAAPAPVELSEQEYHALQAQLARIEAEGHTLERVYRGPDGTLHLRAKRAPDPNRPGMSEQKGPVIPYQPGLMTEAEFVACAKATHSLGGSPRITSQYLRGRGGSYETVCRDGRLGQSTVDMALNAAKASHGNNHGPKKDQSKGELLLKKSYKDSALEVRNPIPSPNKE